MTITDSEVIIGVLEFIGNFLDKVGDFLSTDFGLITMLTTASLIGLNIVATKILEHKVALKNQKIQQQITKEELKQKKLQSDAILKSKEENLLEAKQTLEKLKQAKAEKIAAGASEAEIVALDAQINAQQEVVNQAQAQYDLEKTKNDSLNEQCLLQQQQLTNSLSLTGALSGIVSILGVAFSIFQGIAMVSALIVKLKDKEYRQTLRNTIAAKAQAAVEKIKAAFGMADSASDIPYVGWIIAAAILATLVGVAIATAVNSANQYEKSAEGTANKINELSNEIYKLNEKANALNEIGDAFDNIDNKLIKTNKDLKEMSNLLDQAADKLSDEVDEDEDIGYGKGVSEKEYYESFSTNAGKRQALADIERNNRKKANEKRTEQINKIKSLSPSELDKFLNENTSNAEIRQAQDAIYALNNNELYEYIDAQKDSKELTESQASAIESLTQSILEEMSVEEAWAYAKDDNGTKVQSLVQQIQGLVVEVKNLDGELEKLNVAEVLMSDDYSLKEQVNAYKETLASLERLGDDAATNAFKDTFAQYDYFADLDSNILDFIDHVGLSIDELNELNGA